MDDDSSRSQKLLQRRERVKRFDNKHGNGGGDIDNVSVKIEIMS